MLMLLVVVDERNNGGRYQGGLRQSEKQESWSKWHQVSIFLLTTVLCSVWLHNCFGLLFSLFSHSAHTQPYLML